MKKKAWIAVYIVVAPVCALGAIVIGAAMLLWAIFLMVAMQTFFCSAEDAALAE